MKIFVSVYVGKFVITTFLKSYFYYESKFHLMRMNFEDRFTMMLFTEMTHFYSQFSSDSVKVKLIVGISMKTG